MSERFNTILSVDREILHEERANVIFTLMKAFSPIFDVPDEICIVDWRENSSDCVKWPAGRKLLEAPLSSFEILSIYGESLERAANERGSIHFEGGLKSVVSISLPKSSALESFNSHAISHIKTLQYMAEGLAADYVLAGGWELEWDGDASQNMELALESYFGDSSLCSWVAAPKKHITKCPKNFVIKDESDHSILLRREI
jgi:hypothetical protein